jgi:hypothetical protein
MNSSPGFPDDKLWKYYLDYHLVKNLKLEESYLDILQEKLPLKLDEFKGSAEMALLFNSEIDLYYQQSLINVVTETNFVSPDIFNTEKIFKPIIHRQPFIVVGPYQTLANLKKMGYKTFSDFWDESYDDIEDPTKRLIKIVELCREISNWDDTKKKILFYKSMINTNHNYNLLTSCYPKNMRSNFWHEFRDKKLFPIK